MGVSSRGLARPFKATRREHGRMSAREQNWIARLWNGIRGGTGITVAVAHNGLVVSLTPSGVTTGFSVTLSGLKTVDVGFGILHIHDTGDFPYGPSVALALQGAPYSVVYLEAQTFDWATGSIKSSGAADWMVPPISDGAVWRFPIAALAYNVTNDSYSMQHIYHEGDFHIGNPL